MVCNWVSGKLRIEGAHGRANLVLHQLRGQAGAEDDVAAIAVEVGGRIAQRPEEIFDLFDSAVVLQCADWRRASLL